MNELTPRQSEVYEAIKVHIEKVGFPPTLIELAELIGCSSQNAAAEHVKALKKKGYISIAPGVARGISVVKTDWVVNPVSIVRDLLSGGDKARDNAVEWLKKQGVTL
ncbi:LexA family transcriptional regulator [Enterobacter roggenkampii]|uniref:LexA family protein n=1 Tax=Enterobacter roggenkampii TaxID=1812935 RepID=UPI0021FBBC7D|nr:LexA family transcriptional regulator [Enterobacter roggenkampii]BDS20493.1 LexA family transcriptional regulator [Enterobacter roggenkampii]